MRKNWLLVIYLTIQVHSLYSFTSPQNPISHVAENFLISINSNYSKSNFSFQNFSQSGISEFKNKDFLLGYVVELSPQGFVVLSPDRDFYPVLCYSLTQKWNPDSTNQFHSFLRKNIGYLYQHKEQISDAVKQKNQTMWMRLSSEKLTTDDVATFEQFPDPNTTITGGWVETTWNQNIPYRKYCPIDTTTNNRTPVGCVATALAQIVNYHQFIGSLQLTLDDIYTTKTRRITIDLDSTRCDFPSFRTLNTLLTRLQNKYESDITPSEDEIAALNFVCGILIKMDYLGQSSAALPQNVPNALVNKLGYKSGDYYLETWLQFYDQLKENMMNGQPDLLTLLGHAIVVDGYNTDEFFHLNFGWGSGSPDQITQAWYHIPQEIPADFEKIYNGILNIYPSLDNNTKLETNKNSLFIPGSVVNTLSEAESFTLTNNGTVPIEISKLSCSEYFYISQDKADFMPEIGPYTINPNESRTFYVACLPDTFREYSGTLQIRALTNGVHRYLSLDLKGYGMPTEGTVIYGGDVYGVWTRDKSPYFIGGDIQVKGGKSLIIKEGVQVRFLDHNKLTVGEYAQLIARGTEEEQVLFMPDQEDVFWNGIDLINSNRDDTLLYCQFSYSGENSKMGGVIYADDSSPFIEQCIFKHNIADKGGAIYSNISSPYISYCTFEYNQANNGGAVYFLKGFPVIFDCLFQNNHANSSGGAICHDYYSWPSSDPNYVFNIFNSKIFNNTAATGAGIQFTGKQLNLQNCLIAYNIADETGGAIGLTRGNQSVNYSTIVRNSAGNKGGAIAVTGYYANDLIVNNSILWDNKSNSNTGHEVSSEVRDKSTCFLNFCNVDTTKENWQFISDNPLYPQDILLGNNILISDPMFVDADNDDFHLNELSPCVDAANSEYPVGDEPFPNGYRRNLGFYGGTSEAAKTTGKNLTAAPVMVDFGPVKIGENHEKAIWLKNGSLYNIDVDDIYLNDNTNFNLNFQNEKSTFDPVSLLSGDSLEIKVNYIGEQTNTVTDTVIIEYDKNKFKYVPVQARPLIGTVVNAGQVYGEWTKDNSPYCIFGNIFVPDGQCLHIHPGVDIIVMGDYQITIDPGAQFLAKGLPDDSISITMDDDVEKWSGFYFNNTGDDDTLSYCHVFNNIVLGLSGFYADNLFYFVNSLTVFQNNTFEHNTITGYAKLLYLYSSNLVLSNCWFSKNTISSSRGLLTVQYSNPLIEQTLFCDNITSHLVDIYSNSQVTFNNITVKQNTASILIYLSQMSCLNIWNSIIWDNNITNAAVMDAYDDYYIDIAYSNIDTLSKQLLKKEDLNAGFHWGPGNLCQDPLFADSNGLLQTGSPCIDTANPNDPVGNEPFPHGFRRNMGAWGGTVNAAATEDVFLAVAPSELSFGIISVGQPASKTVYCKNGCNEAINISSIELTDTTDFKISQFNDITVLQPGMVDSFTIIYDPQQGNDENISSVVFHCSNCPSETLHVSGSSIEGSVVKAGNVSGVWTKESSPYTVLGNINIPDNKSLVIEPGVHVKFFSPYGMTIGTGAQLKAMGAENDSIYFYAADSSKGWCGLYFNHSEEDDTLSFCNIFGVRTFTDEYFKSLPAYAVRCDNSDLCITHSSIYNNTNDTDGVGFYGDSASVTISHCCFRNNHSLSSGSAFYLSQSQLNMKNSRVTNNYSQYGGAFYCGNSNVYLTNVSVAYNKSSSIKGSSFHLAGGNNVLMKNCIFWHNTASYYTFCYMDKTDYIDMSYSNIDTTRSSWLNLKNENVYDWHESNISQDPMFIDADLHLDIDSPSIDAGDPNDDVSDEIFPHGYCVNQGAYGGTKNAAQTSGVHLTIAPNPVDLGYIQPGSDVNFDLYLKNGCVADLGIKQVLLSDSINIQCLNSLSFLTVPSGHIDTLHFKMKADSLLSGPFSKSILVQTNDDQNTIIKIIGNVHKGSTITEGPINGILQKEGGPYIVSGNIYVPSSEILTITAGTELLFLENSSLQIPENAGLQVNGTLDDPVCFMAIDTSKGWGGIKIISSQDDDTLRHCLIRDCKNRQTYSGSKGGGLFISESSPYMDYVTISDNRAYYGGGGYISKSSPYINHSTIQNNNAYNGSALFVVGSTPVISNSYFFENLADSKGAIYLKNSSPIFNNTMICNNNSNEGGAFYCAGSNKKIILSNVTISANHAQQNAGAFYLNSIDSLFINNSIIWHNQARYGKEFYTYSYYRLSTCYVDLDYCDIDTTMSYWNRGYYTNNYFKVNIHWRSTNIVANPQFLNSDLYDYRLASGSPCIDRGNPDPAFNDPEDVLNPGQALLPSRGTVRNDMGAYGGGHGFDVNTSVKSEENMVPLSYDLKQNYPNPFNPVTNIEFHLPKPGHVRLIIYNILGQKVKTLVNSKRKAGVYHTIWDGKNQTGFQVSSGLYFYRLTVNNYEKTGKMVLIR